LQPLLREDSNLVAQKDESEMKMNSLTRRNLRDEMHHRKERSSWLKCLMVVALACGLLSVSAPARADITLGGGDWSGLGGLFAIGIAGEVMVSVGGLVTGIPNGVIAARGHKPHWGWQLAGGVFCALNFIAGGIMIGAFRDIPPLLGLGIANIGIGAMDLGFVIWGATREENPRRVSLSPLVMPDAKGQLSYGATVRVSGW
jgi:hypothetical protein